MWDAEGDHEGHIVGKQIATRVKVKVKVYSLRSDSYAIFNWRATFSGIGQTPLEQSHLPWDNTAHMSYKYLQAASATQSQISSTRYQSLSGGQRQYGVRSSSAQHIYSWLAVGVEPTINWITCSHICELGLKAAPLYINLDWCGAIY